MDTNIGKMDVAAPGSFGAHSVIEMLTLLKQVPMPVSSRLELIRKLQEPPCSIEQGLAEWLATNVRYGSGIADADDAAAAAAGQTRCCRELRSH